MSGCPAPPLLLPGLMGAWWLLCWPAPEAADPQAWPLPAYCEAKSAGPLAAPPSWGPPPP